VQEFDNYRERTMKETKRYKEELVGLFDLVQQLTKIVQDLENGTYPTQYKCGVQMIQLPYGVKAKIPTEKTFDKLFQALSDVKVKCNRYTKMQADMAPQAPNVSANWDANKFALDYVRTGEDSAPATLAHLNRDQLSSLAESLRRICADGNLEKEKAAVREQVMQELSSHQTIEYIRHLEQELAKRAPGQRRPPTTGGVRDDPVRVRADL
jgi:hypothetical protein